MDLRFRYTGNQTARGALADAEKAGKIYLIKAPSELRLTYQIRLLAFRALSEGKKLVIDLPKQSNVHRTLRDFVSQYPKLIQVEKS